MLYFKTGREYTSMWPRTKDMSNGPIESRGPHEHQHLVPESWTTTYLWPSTCAAPDAGFESPVKLCCTATWIVCGPVPSAHIANGTTMDIDYRQHLANVVFSSQLATLQYMHNVRSSASNHSFYLMRDQWRQQSIAQGWYSR